MATVQHQQRQCVGGIRVSLFLSVQNKNIHAKVTFVLEKRAEYKISFLFKHIHMYMSILCISIYIYDKSIYVIIYILL
jgi:hypothetical protein